MTRLQQHNLCQKMDNSS